MAALIDLDLLTRYDTNIKNYINTADNRLIITYKISTANTSVSYASGTLTGISYTDWGDGTTADKNSNSHTYTAVGTYTAYFYSVTAIGQEAFKNQTTISSAFIPKSVTSIGASAFYGCTILQDVTIGQNVTSIGNSAFYNDVGLREVLLLPRTTVPTLGTQVFYAYAMLNTAISLVLPITSKTLIGTYKAATNWASYTTMLGVEATTRDIENAKGVVGSISIGTTGWTQSGTNYYKNITTVTGNDLVLIYPSTLADKTNMESLNFFTDVSSGNVRAWVNAIPSSAIIVNTYTIRGKS